MSLEIVYEGETHHEIYFCDHCLVPMADWEVDSCLVEGLAEDDQRCDKCARVARFRTGT